MRLYDIRGRLVNRNILRYQIKWDGKSRSIIQWKVKQFLKPYWQRMACYEEFPVYGSLLKVDILNLTLKIAIEVQGDQHNNFNAFFHNNNRAVYLKGITNDSKKYDWLEKNEIKLIEVNEEEIPMLSKQFFADKFGLVL